MMYLGFFGGSVRFWPHPVGGEPAFPADRGVTEQLPILNLAAPVTGLVIQPLIKAASDRTWSPRWGRRRPFITIGALLCSIILFVFPFVGVLWLAWCAPWLQNWLHSNENPWSVRLELSSESP
jgi:maltose/moltooligosaccharide transporter